MNKKVPLHEYFARGRERRIGGTKDQRKKIVLVFRGRVLSRRHLPDAGKKGKRGGNCPKQLGANRKTKKWERNSA